MLFSIGHSNKTIQQLIEELQSFEIKYLIDVRSKPFSRFNPQFNRNRIKSSLEEAGIVYVYMGDILGGIPNDKSCYTDNRVDYSKLEKKDFFRNGLERLKTACEKNIQAAIMCSEKDPANCHRSKLIGINLSRLRISLIHITGTGQCIDQETLMRDKRGGTGELEF